MSDDPTPEFAFIPTRVPGAICSTTNVLGCTRPRRFIGYSLDWWIRPGAAPMSDRFTSYEVIVRDAGGGVLGDGSSWTFDRDTAQPDITAYELARILSISLTLPDGMMGPFKSEPALLRHFQRTAPAGFVDDA